jgi:hypothetical protein
MLNDGMFVAAPPPPRKKLNFVKFNVICVNQSPLSHAKTPGLIQTRNIKPKSPYKDSRICINLILHAQ